MELDFLGSMQFNNTLLNDNVLNRTGGLHSRNAPGNVSDFEALLRRTAPQTAAEHSESTALSTPATLPASRAAVIDRDSKLYEQCVELEIFMVKTLISSMRNTIQKSSLIDEGFAGKMYEDMLYDEYTRNFTQSANFGMAEMAYLELTGQRGRTVIR